MLRKDGCFLLTRHVNHIVKSTELVQVRAKKDASVMQRYLSESTKLEERSGLGELLFPKECASRLLEIERTVSK